MVSINILTLSAIPHEFIFTFLSNDTGPLTFRNIFYVLETVVLWYVAKIRWRIVFKGGFFFILLSMYVINCFFCCPSDSSVSGDAGIEPRTVALSSQTL